MFVNLIELFHKNIHDYLNFYYNIYLFNPYGIKPSFVIKYMPLMADGKSEITG